MFTANKSISDIDHDRRTFLGPTLYSICAKGGALTDSLIQDRINTINSDPHFTDILRQKGISQMNAKHLIKLCGLNTGTIREDIYKLVPLSETVGLAELEKKGIPKDVIDFIIARQIRAPEYSFNFTTLPIEVEFVDEFVEDDEMVEDFVNQYYSENDSINSRKLFNDVIAYITDNKLECRDEPDIKNGLQQLAEKLIEYGIEVDFSDFSDKFTKQLRYEVENDRVVIYSIYSKSWIRALAVQIFEDHWEDPDRTGEREYDDPKLDYTLRKGQFMRSLINFCDEWELFEQGPTVVYTYDTQKVSKILPEILQELNDIHRRNVIDVQLENQNDLEIENEIDE